MLSKEKWKFLIYEREALRKIFVTLKIGTDREIKNITEVPELYGNPQSQKKWQTVVVKNCKKNWALASCQDVVLSESLWKRSDFIEWFWGRHKSIRYPYSETCSSELQWIRFPKSTVIEEARSGPSSALVCGFQWCNYITSCIFCLVTNLFPCVLFLYIFPYVPFLKYF